MILASVFGFMMQPMLLTENSPGPDNRFNTIPWLIFAQVENGTVKTKANIPAAAALGLILSLFIVPLVAVIRWLCKKFTPEVSF